MDQHPVPQNISSYEFRLVGDMTLKQFFQLAGGGAAGLIFYRSPFPFYIKYPLVFVSVLVGILLAFVPLNGRPFSQWILAFIKAVYSPTQYFWNPTPINVQGSMSNVHSNLEPRTQNLEPSYLDKLESQLFSKFSALFQQTHPTPSNLPARNAFSIVDAGGLPPPPINPVTSTATFIPAINHSPLNISTLAQPDLTTLFAPTQPNILAGNIVDSTGHVLEGVILEIAEKASGMPVRALRSNKLGQFQIATPLPRGEYVLTCEKDGWAFDKLLINATGQIITPIQIRAKGII